jgi:prepilin peptidase CpaA
MPQVRPMTFLSPTLPFQTFYVFCVAYAIVSDIRHLKIPNWICAILAFAFLPYCALFWPNIDLLSHLEITLVIFLLSFLFYYLHWLGGGDVKFLTALSIWMGPLHIFTFVMVMAVLGSLLAFLILNLRWFLNVHNTARQSRLPRIVRRWAEEGLCPYGIAIGIAGLAMGPQIFA